MLPLMGRANAPVRGRLELICGPMFSGKSEELIRRLTAAAASGLRVAAAKPSVEIDPDWIVSLAGTRWPATPIADARTLLSLGAQQDVIGVDEVQFLGPEILDVVDALRGSNVRVIAAGLDLDFRGEPFGPVPALASRADALTALVAVCARCGGIATRSQRLLDGEPAAPDAPVVQVGGSELYEPRCVRCHEVRRLPSHNLATS
jgi:thymidine kinase